MGNVNKATAVGVVGGAGSFSLLPLIAQYAEQKYGVPMQLSLPILGSAAGLFMRWAAKLHPAQ